MRALILNLAGQTERMAVQKAQMAALGLDWERLPAVTPETLSRKPDDSYWASWQRPMRDTEKAVLESHQNAWEKVIASDAPCLILEDDALLSASTPRLLRAVQPVDGIDHLTLETRGRKKLLGDQLGDLPVRRLYQDRTGAAAYVLWPNGARILLRNTARAAALADAAICGSHNLRSFQAVPALAIQIDHCAHYGITPPIQVKSTIDVQRKPFARDGFRLGQRFAFRARRIWAQIRMGLRQLRYRHKAGFSQVEPASDWPELKL